MIAQSASSAKPLIAVSAIVVMGALIGLGTVLALTLVRPVLFAFAFGGIVLLIPTFVVRDPRAYWLFLLVLSMPFEISKSVSTWLVAPWVLQQEYGPSMTLSLDLSLTDAVLFAMLLPWLARLCLRWDRLHFPNIGYIFVLYLAWALIVSLMEAESFYLSIFEWCREVLYLLLFVYLINNVVTHLQFRAIFLALLIGLAIESGIVIALFHFGIGTDTDIISGAYREHEVPTKLASHITYYGSEHSHLKRSSGTFPHPAETAYYLQFTLSIALASLAAAGFYRDRILSGVLFAMGCVALYLTFSRAGLAGFIVGGIVFFVLARRSRLVSKRGVAGFVLIFVIAAGLGVAAQVGSAESQRQTIQRRLELNELALDAYWQRPILGVGLNNSSAVIKEGSEELRNRGRRAPPEAVHNEFVLVLTEVGLVGFLLFFGFFWQIVRIALHSMRAAEPEMKVLLVGTVASFSGIATHMLADGFGGHAINAMLWLFAGLIVAIARRFQAERALPAAGRAEPVTP